MHDLLPYWPTDPLFLLLYFFKHWNPYVPFPKLTPVLHWGPGISSNTCWDPSAHRTWSTPLLVHCSSPVLPRKDHGTSVIQKSILHSHQLFSSTVLMQRVIQIPVNRSVGQKIDIYSRSTDLKVPLILLCLFRNDLLVFLKDGRHALKPMDGLCVELHVQWWEGDEVHQVTQLCVGVWQSFLQQGHLIGLHLTHEGLDGVIGQQQTQLRLP